MSLVGADRALERDEDALRALSSLRLFPLENGMLRVSGQLDPEAGAVLTAGACQVVCVSSHLRMGFTGAG